MTENIFPETIEVEGLTFSYDLVSDTEIHEVDLNSEYCKQAVLYAKYATAYERAVRRSGRVKVELEQLCIQIDVKARQEAKINDVKMTERMVENTVKGSTDYLSKHDELLQAQWITGLLKSACNAMIHKKEMLVQLGYTQRQERASELTMRTIST